MAGMILKMGKLLANSLLQKLVQSQARIPMSLTDSGPGSHNTVSRETFWYG
jgi:hypothetical protein